MQPRSKRGELRKRLLTIFAILAMVVGPTLMVTVSAKPASADVGAPSWWNGTACDTANYPGSYALGAAFNGVKACGPGPNQGGTDHLVRFYSGAWGEYEWECVELSMRYMYQVYGIAPYSAPGGKDVVANYSGSVLSKITNNGASTPTPGDVLSFGATTNFPSGHTGVVTAANIDSNGNGTITIMQQNVSTSVSPNGWGTVPVSGRVLGNSTTGWLHNPNYAPPPPPNKIGDITGDGKADLAWYYSGTTDMQVLASDGTTFNGGFSQKPAGVPTWGALADVNGDGKADLVWYYRSLGTVQVMLSDGANFNGPSSTKTVGDPTWAAVGDVNGDGKADLAWYYAATNDMEVLFSDGSNFNAGMSQKPVGTPTWGALADVNGDGKADLVWYYKSLGLIQVLQSNGTTFNGPSYNKTVGDPTWAGVGDVNGDGKADLAWYYGATTDMQVLLSDGTTFNGGFSQKPAGVPTWGGLEDVNGDGKADLVWYYRSLGLVQVLQSNGANFNGPSYNKTVGDPFWAGGGNSPAALGSGYPLS
jgi:hypothetical protein